MENIISKIIGVILAGGSGSRFGSTTPKQFLKINNKRVVDYSIEKFKKVVDEVVVVTNQEYYHMFNDVHLVENGIERYYSLDNALKYVRDTFGEDVFVVSHDSARPLVDELDIQKVISKVSKNNVVSLAKKSTSTFVLENQIVNRDLLCEILTPQAIYVKKYFETNILNESCTDLCSYANVNKIDFELVNTEKNNIKITHPEDIKIVNYILGENNG